MCPFEQFSLSLSWTDFVPFSSVKLLSYPLPLACTSQFAINSQKLSSTSNSFAPQACGHQIEPKPQQQPGVLLRIQHHPVNKDHHHLLRHQFGVHKHLQRPIARSFAQWSSNHLFFRANTQLSVITPAPWLHLGIATTQNLYTTLSHRVVRICLGIVTQPHSLSSNTNIVCVNRKVSEATWHHGLQVSDFERMRRHQQLQLVTSMLICTEIHCRTVNLTLTFNPLQYSAEYVYICIADQRYTSSPTLTYICLKALNVLKNDSKGLNRYRSVHSVHFDFTEKFIQNNKTISDMQLFNVYWARFSFMFPNLTWLMLFRTHTNTFGKR